MKKVYISGAIAHHDLAERKATFAAAARRLSEEGYFPVNPFDNGLGDDADRREHMRVDIGMLVECDCIYMLKGWRESKGAKLEHDVATTCGLSVKYEKDSWTPNNKN